MNLTLSSDASFNHKLLRGTFAFAIVCNLGRYKASGPLRGKCMDATEAEMKSIVNGLTFLLHSPETMKTVTNIYINTDSLNAIWIFQDDRANRKSYRLFKDQHKAPEKLYNEIIKNPIFKGKKIIFSHVKAHSGVADKRSMVNEWCDSAAKEEMKKIIDKSKTEKPA